jgi:hypothetical protein
MKDVIDPVEALRKLTNEVGATLGAEHALRSALGNTNYNVLRLRYEEARAALTAAMIAAAPKDIQKERV